MSFTPSSLSVADPAPPPSLFAQNTRILFQGDSITDGNRGRDADPNHILGHGYAFLIAARHGAAYPERNLRFVNRGVSGNRIPDLAARWTEDTLGQGPDLLSVLVGVNDIAHRLESGRPTCADAYEQTFDRLLADTRAVCPRCLFVLCEPFILPGPRTETRWLEWRAAAEELQAAVARLAFKYAAPVVRFQKTFDAAAGRGFAPDYWIWDGIHPTYSGHQLMADEWVRAVHAFYGDAV